MKTKSEIQKLAEDLEQNYVTKLQDRIGEMRRKGFKESMIAADRDALLKYSGQLEILKFILAD